MLQEESEEPSSNTTYNNFPTSHGKPAVDVIPLKPKHQQNIPWESNHIAMQMSNVKGKATIRNSNTSFKSI